jgi:hypothetical protein
MRLSSPPFLPRLFLIAACIFSLTKMSPARASAAEVAKIFDLPAEPAERSLKKFSTQSGLEVLFVTETAANITTNTVRGNYTPRQAIELLLAGTPLIAAQDPRSGALRISRQATTPPVNPRPDDRPVPNVARAPAVPTPDETLVLSPFLVDADRESGYQATSTLAGNRIRTPLEDFCAAV